MTNSRRSPPPLDAAKLEALALRYVERFATTRGKLADYLVRKVRERGWSGDAADPVGLAEQMAQLGYVNDGMFAEARARSLTRRGYGVRRVSQALRAAHVEESDAAPALEQSADESFASAMALARRRRFGPYAQKPTDDRTRERQIAAMLRAGHSFALARRIVSAAPGEELEAEH